MATKQVWKGTQRNIRRARELAEKYDIPCVNPDFYMPPTDISDELDDLLKRIK